MAWMNDTYKKAREAATEAYDKIYPQQMYAAYRKLPKDRELAIRELTSKYLPFIQSEYPEKSWTPKMAAELAESKVGDWVDYGETEDRQFSPRYKAEQRTFEKYKDLVDDQKWIGMDKYVLDKKMSELGFDPNNKKSVNDFYRVLGAFDSQYQKAKTVDEFSKTPAGFATSVFYPTAYNEAVQQALTDAPYDEDRVKNARNIDAATAVLMSQTVPIGNAIAGTLGTGAVEMGRQIANSAILDHQMHPENTIGAMGAAFTVPQGVKMLGSLARQGANDVRGFGGQFMRGARGIPDPLKQEENQLIALAKRVRADEKKGIENMNLYQQKGANEAKNELIAKLKTLDYDETNEAFWKSTDPEDQLVKELYRQANMRTNEPMGRKYSIQDVIDPSIKEKDVLKNLRESYNAPAEGLKVGEFAQMMEQANLRSPLSINGEDAAAAQGAVRRINALQANFPNKLAKEQGNLPSYDLMSWGEAKNAPWDAVAYALGRTSAGLGGTVEAYTQMNPYSIVRDLSTGKENPATKAKAESYKNEQWFLDLMENNPEMAKAFEAAYKKGKK